MSIFVTSDCHFGHKNILRYCPNSRPFEDTDIHDAVIIENWNSVVKSEDTVYVLGDFFMGPIELIDKILPQLNGHIRLVCGNHDEKRRLRKFEEYGVDILAYRDGYYFFYDGVSFYMNHFPYEQTGINLCADIYLYGHVHDNAPKGLVEKDGTYSFHVGVDTNDLTPVNIENITKLYKEIC